MVYFNNSVLCLYSIILSLNLVGYSPPLCLLFCFSVCSFACCCCFLVIPEEKICDGCGNVNHLEIILFILLRTSRWCLFHYFEAISSSLHLYIHRITPCFHTIAPNSTRDQITPHLEPSGDCMETRLKTKQSKPLICWLLFIRQ